MGAIHATAVVLGGAGVLLRGPSGSGKSTLARALIDGATGRGIFARLLSDDRVELAARHGRLVARAVPSIAGHMEARGLGLIATPHEPAAVVRLVVDCLAADPPRWPESVDADIEGVVLPRLVGRATPDLAVLILDRLDPDGARRSTFVERCPLRATD